MVTLKDIEALSKQCEELRESIKSTVIKHDKSMAISSGLIKFQEKQLVQLIMRYHHKLTGSF